jgi:hypothetical protein
MRANPLGKLSPTEPENSLARESMADVRLHVRDIAGIDETDRTGD